MKVVIADDHPLTADGIKSNFAREATIEIVYMAKSGKEVLEYVEKNHVDLVLMDIEMPEMNGIECAKQLRRRFPKVKIIILSMYEEPTLIERFMEIGIKGYLLKTAPKEELIAAVKSVEKGQSYFSDEIIANMGNEAKSKVSAVPSFQASKLAQRLSKREIEIVSLLSKGFTNKQIADTLFISSRTVETHRANILKKTKTKNVAGMIRFAFQNGII